MKHLFANPYPGVMAQSTGAKRNGKVKLSRAEKKAGRAQRRQSRRDSFKQMRQAFTLTRKSDARLVPYLIIAFVVVAAVFYLLAFLLTGSIWLPILPAIMFGLLAALFLFSRRAQTSAYRQAEGQAGAAAYVLGQLRGDWRKTDAVAGTPQL
ncbi:MAG TPA: DUF4191 family protein, partial [Jatrophihabitans sp.]